MALSYDMNRKLTKKTMALAEYLISHPFETLPEVAKHMGCSEITVWRVRNNNEFKKMRAERWKTQWEDCQGEVQSKMIELANNGDYKACAYILDSLGLGGTKKVEASVENKVINVTIDEDK